MYLVQNVDLLMSDIKIYLNIHTMLKPAFLNRASPIFTLKALWPKSQKYLLHIHGMRFLITNC